MKLIGHHHQRKKDGSNSNSSRTSPSKLEDTELVKNSLLATNSGDFDEDSKFCAPNRFPHKTNFGNLKLIQVSLRSVSYFELVFMPVRTQSHVGGTGCDCVVYIRKPPRYMLTSTICFWAVPAAPLRGCHGPSQMWVITICYL